VLYLRFVKKSTPEYPKIVIITTARSGSNYLYTLLSSHASIFCEGEIFNPRQLNKKHHPIVVWLIKKNPLWYILHRIRVAKSKRKPIYGFKLFPAQLKSNFESLIPKLIQRNFKIIYLVRLNRVSQILSYLVAEQQDEWVVTANKSKAENPISLDINQVARIVAYYKGVWESVDIAKNQYKGLELVYEYDLVSQDMISTLSQKVSSYLSIPYELLRSKMVKTDTRSDADRIANLAEVLSEMRRLGLNDEVDYYLKAQLNSLS